MLPRQRNITMVCLPTVLLALVIGNIVEICCTDLTLKKVAVRLGLELVTASSCDFPETFRVEFQSHDPFKVTFILKRNDFIDVDAPVYVIKHQSRDLTYSRHEDSTQKKTAVYQSLQYAASFLLRCMGQTYELEGTIYLEGKKYRFVPSKDGSPATPPVTQVSWYDVTEVKDMPFSDAPDNRPVRQAAEIVEQSIVGRSHTGELLRRQRDAVKTEYYLDILAALDYSFYKYWLDRANNVDAHAVRTLKEYIAYIFNGINGRYRSITSLPFNINIVLRGYLIAKTPADSPWTEEIKEEASGNTQISAQKMLKRLREYVNRTTLTQCDHVMGFTEYDLYSDDSGFRFNNTAGFAHVASMCYPDGISSSVVEDHGGFQSELTATHELGHSLGANHDGDSNLCAGADRYIMSPGLQIGNEANKQNPWHFSNCSIEYFKNFTDKLVRDNLENTCLRQRLGQTDVPAVTGLPGYLHGPDEQCRQMFGSTSYLCRGSSFAASSEDVCFSMFCRDPSSSNGSCILTTAAAGTCCNTGKWCIAGLCVQSPNATSCYISQSCPFGQRQGAVFDGRSCDQLESGTCYQNSIREVCCEMCDKRRTNVTNCQYGDRVIGCTSASCGGSSTRLAECCGTCNYKTSASIPTGTIPITASTRATQQASTATPSDVTVNGTTCSAYLAARGKGQCCDVKVGDTCFAACQDVRSADPECRYGDCDAQCQNLTSSLQPCSADQRMRCCTTCSQIDKKKATAAPVVPCRVIPGVEPVCAAVNPLQNPFLTVAVAATARILSAFGSL